MSAFYYSEFYLFFYFISISIMKTKNYKSSTGTSQKIKYLRDSRKHKVALQEGILALVTDAMKLSLLTGTKMQIQLYNSKE